jgi:hypothetical protein
LDVDREARDRRIEDATACVFTRLEERAEVEQTIGRRWYGLPERD